MRTVHTTRDVNEIEEELGLLATSGATLVVFLEHADGAENVLGRWNVGEFFRPNYCSGKRDGLDAARVVGARQRGRTPWW